MKRSIYHIIIAAAVLLATGCADFLEESDPNSIPSDRFFATAADVRMGANGAYAALRGNGYYKNMYLYTEVRSDNTTLQDPGASGGALYQFANYTLLTDNANLKEHWADLYKCVTRTNQVIDAANQVTFASETERDNVIAEMHFLRALTYSHLVFQFGGVPIVTTPLRTKDAIWEHTRRDPKAEVYKLIVSDMDVVLKSQLPDLQTGNGVGRASKAAAHALLGKVYLMMAADMDLVAERNANLQLAQTHLGNAWDMKPFAKLKDIPYADVFDKDKQATCPEILFQVMYQAGSSALGSNYSWNFQPTGEVALTSQKSGSGNNIPTGDLVASYAINASDIRTPLSVAVSPKGVNYTKKYMDLDDANGYGANNWIVIRYADVALMLAEVKLHLGNPDAVAYLNMVRDRAGLATFAGTDLLEAIRQERRVELAFEGQRWYDLLRLYTRSELLTYMQAKNANFSDKDFLLPIPYDEHKLDVERMYQNPGYN